QSVEALQIAYLKSLLVDVESLKEAQSKNDIVMAEEIIKDAFLTDVRSILKESREEIGLDPDAINAFRKSGYESIVAKKRG
ncbi:MAG: sugar isomerase, partial [Thermotogae bacterium]|nr:sugar isomerase [Thermotogota bacterium]